MQALVKYDAAIAAVAEVHRVDEVKHYTDLSAALVTYARLSKDYRLLEWAADIHERWVRRLGEVMEADKAANQRAKEGRPKRDQGDPVSAPTLDDLGVSKGLASRARRAAKLPPEKFEARCGLVRQAVTKATDKSGAKPSKTDAQTGNDEWNTPLVYIEMVRSVLGEIDIDPASNEFAQTRVKATTFYTKDNSGLDQPWPGRVFLNPPYSRKLIVQFIDKLLLELREGRTTAAILLVNNSTETEWFYAAGSCIDAICFPSARIKFNLPNGDEAESPIQGQAFMYFGPDHKSFIDVFGKIGLCYRL